MKKKTRYVLLGLLQEENLTGYEIKKIIDNRLKFFWQESYGQIYPELNLMFEEGLICKAENSNDKTTRREKIRYQITEKGRLVLKKWMKEDNEKETIRNEFLLKMYLSTEHDIKNIRNHLQKFNEQSQKQLEIFKEYQKELRENISLHQNHKHILNVLELGIMQQEIYTTWSSKLIQTFENRENRYD